ncbi:hypothetical protein [Salinicola tamaricis]|uniref:hypothetical protein n=1 Tax=Salinicola tamaricis TaxID=1771309 RepID=UPI000D0A7182|nr:hypothetical protein [Salinicola tamaricis]
MPMAEGYLRRRIDGVAASQRLRRYAAARFEPAWLALWAVALTANEAQTPDAWLLGRRGLSRALLWPGPLGHDAWEYDAPAGAETRLGGETREAGCPSPEAFARWWLWERLAKPRLWSLRVQPATLQRLWLPLWLGYHQGRQTRLIVLSGVSGEPLGALKPAVLAALQAEARAGAD